mgnify:CR=1 FL=1
MNFKEPIFTLFILFSCQLLPGQIYDFLNDINEKGTIRLQSDFEPWDKHNLSVYFSIRFFEENWVPFPVPDAPSYETFIASVDLDKMKKKVLNDSIPRKINFDSLSPNFKEVRKQDFINGSIDFYSAMTQPLFNDKNDFAIIYRYEVYRMDVGHSSKLLIFRKLNRKWQYYHTITINIH